MENRSIGFPVVKDSAVLWPVPRALIFTSFQKKSEVEENSRQNPTIWAKKNTKPYIDMWSTIQLYISPHVWKEENCRKRPRMDENWKFYEQTRARLASFRRKSSRRRRLLCSSGKEKIQITTPLASVVFLVLWNTSLVNGCLFSVSFWGSCLQYVGCIPVEKSMRTLQYDMRQQVTRSE